MSALQIDYDALAEALAKRGLLSFTGLNDRGGGCVEVSDQSVEKGSSLVAGLGTVKSEGIRGVVVQDTASVGSSGVDVRVERSVGVSSSGAVACEKSVDGSDFDVVGDGDSEGSMSGGEPLVVSDVVRNGVTFGGMVDVERERDKVAAKGFYASVVRSPEARSLRAAVEALMCAVLPKAAARDLAICTYTAGTMPLSLARGKDRLNVLALVGDAAISMHVCVHCLSLQKTPEETTVMRSSVASDHRLRDTLVRRGWVKFVNYPPGVDPVVTKASATCLEALIGVVVMWCDVSAVSRLLRGLELF